MAQITNDRAADRPRLRLIPGGQAAAAHREEQKRRAELQQFIKACEALYEKNRAAQTIIYLQEDASKLSVEYRKFPP